MKRKTTTVLAAVACLAGAAIGTAAGDLPNYSEKPDTWRSNLVTIEGPMVSDKDFAGWLKKADAMVADKGGALTVLAAFNQCFGGGFLAEMERARLPRFGAVSASRYYQPAYYRSLDEFKNDATGGGSYFTRAWIAALEKGRTNKWDDRQVAEEAHARKGIDTEHTQYNSSQKDRAGVESFGGVVHSIIVLFVGDPDPDGRDSKSVTELADQLARVYLMKKRPAVLVLYGDGTPPDNLRKEFSWEKADNKSHAATRANLEHALTNKDGWLARRVGEIKKGDRVQLLFWASDHGNAERSAWFSVAPGSKAMAGTDIRADKAPHSKAWEGGLGKHKLAWEPPNPMARNADVNAISFDNDTLPPLDSVLPGEFYFSVDEPSVGVKGSEVHTERVARGNRPARRAATDIFAGNSGSNRQVADGERSFALDEAKASTDDLNAFAFQPPDAIGKDGQPTTLVFWSRTGSSVIEVYDPAQPMGARVYDFVDLYEEFGWPKDDKGNPTLKLDIDALIVNVDVAARPDRMGDPDPDNPPKPLAFMPGKDRILFSISRDSHAPFVMERDGMPCDVFSFDGFMLSIVRSCAELGLLAPDPGNPDDKTKPDNLNALEYFDLPIGERGGENGLGLTPTMHGLPDFLRDHATGDPSADLNRDGRTDALDVVRYLEALRGGGR
ncbi:MAG: hypothetical protein DYG93_01810 [Leptolyngbya sp. PLA2]|nr:hypothetical protein [Leptolyngbya sp. PL-A2]MCQ3941049.1 hypothetical protein [cyanobacterium CYA1]MCZ7633087.1 hypothetical protein [Phycisphaerales bacterium]MDL1905642.1 hypothetical protein [Synechococcales cyanobacterium CNB]GIK18853.1 MAG: hypothetical protein BroJett004_10170 [Planctomycetota bacterium]